MHQYREALEILTEMAELEQRNIRLRPWDRRDNEERLSSLFHQLKDVGPFVLAKGKMVNLGSYGLGIYQGADVAWAALRERVPPDQIVQSAHDIIKANKAPFRRVNLLLGIEGDFDHRVGDLRVRSRNFQERFDAQAQLAHDPINAARDMMSGAAVEFDYEDVLFGALDEDTGLVRGAHADKMDKVIAALTLSSDAPVSLGMSYTRPLSFAFPSRSRSPNIGDLSFGGEAGTIKIDFEAFDKIYLGLERLGKKDWNAIRIAASRLSRSRQWPYRNPETSVIDLMIALEILTTFGGNQKSEVGYRVKTHAALLSSASSAERLANSKTITALYDLRSTAVHQGAVNHKKYLEHRLKGDEIVRQVAEAIIDREGFPDWGELVLTNPSVS